ncbi:hypothetical protein D6D12_01869 [Aureobasidium pullulans]|uniref:Uncharacterized protein n=1 Tax=Aureobasidium pullulans TaxID=5580 RepID=A0A4S9EFJ9_AURPU|nr:hypothetical protein D6D12_01869 [Aureobasidium pullulans]THX64764.1 hypothetical protein D6D11_00942 [Aureobasidium pullulans]THX78581.1 hypothetical protein D6D04_05664 [Aureobasidium pullulans]
MDNTRFAWQKSIWVSLTLEGDRKNLITPCQRTSSGLACRNIFNTQFVQLLEDYDTYGPHKGFFVPRLEPGNDPEIAFEIHWDVLSDVLHEPGTATAYVAKKPAEELPTLDSILDSHNRRKKQKLMADHVDQSPPQFAETQCEKDTQALPVTSDQETASDLTPVEIHARFEAEFHRRKALGKRERIGLLKSSGTLASMVGMKKVLHDMNKQVLGMKDMLRTHYQEQLQDTEPSNSESEAIVDALNYVELTLEQISCARGHLGGRDFENIHLYYSFAITFMGPVAKTCMMVASRGAMEAQHHDGTVEKSDGFHEGSHDSEPPQTKSDAPVDDKLTENARNVRFPISALDNQGGHSEENAKPQISPSPYQIRLPKKYTAVGDYRPRRYIEVVEVDDNYEAMHGAVTTKTSAAEVTAQPASTQPASTQPASTQPASAQPASTQPTESSENTPTTGMLEENTAPAATDDQAKFPGFGRDTRKDGTYSFRWTAPLAGIKFPFKWEGF